MLPIRLHTDQFSQPWASFQQLIQKCR